MDIRKPRVSFTLDGLKRGAIMSRVLLPSVGVYGLAFGIMAATTGLSSLEATLISAWVYAGGAQFATLQAWADPVPLVAVCLLTLAMNARYLLLGAALRPWFSRLPAYQSYPSLFLMGDTNWAMALREYGEGREDGAFLLGSGLAMWAVWIATTWAGHSFGAILGNPQAYGVDFMLAAFFASMAVAFFREWRDVMPFIVGALVAIVIQQAVPGPWYILAGAVVGSLVGALRRVDPA